MRVGRRICKLNDRIGAKVTGETEPKKTAILFPGQGSQFIGMGREFLETDASASDFMAMAESASGMPVRRLCLEGPMVELTRALHLQPALTVINLICWQPLARAGIKADFFAGHSLGEYSALCAAGVLSPEDTLALVTERGRLMEREGRKHPGGMVAVIGMVYAQVQEILDGLTGAGIVTAANHNSDKQVVIAGEHAALKKAAAVFSEKGARCIPLQVSVANHSPLVADAVDDFEQFMGHIAFQTPGTPVLFNVTADSEDDPAGIRRMMARQIASRVRWLDIIRKMLSAEVRVFIEVGPGNVLSGLLKKVVPRDYEHQRFQVDTPEKAARVIEALNHTL
jgi:[acyl-carrier-protein] S-malonyltransferase